MYNTTEVKKRRYLIIDNNNEDMTTSVLAEDSNAATQIGSYILKTNDIRVIPFKKSFKHKVTDSLSVYGNSPYANQYDAYVII